MKSDHRHELKTNELADWLTHFPEWARENRTTLIGAGVVVVLLIGVYFVRFYRMDVDVRHHVRLTNLVTQVPAQKRVIAQAASQGTDQSIKLLPVAQDLEDFAQSIGNDRLGALALIKRGEALRAELHYRLAEPSREEVTKQIAQARTSYEQALERASSNPVLAAMAEFGLGLCDEELGNFDEAKAAYQAVADNPDYEGTAPQAAAAHRLKTMDDYQGAVVFKPAPQPQPAAASVPTIQLGPDAVNSPITIDAADDIYVAPPTPAETSDSDNVAEPGVDAGGAGATETTEANEPTSN
ncbi:MAG: tetratricopeptide repeat protein [Phycisphaerales bacterium]|nr:MAG: tetratricopeptide repeat protein [Phycisphaerales bacterium]